MKRIESNQRENSIRAFRDFNWSYKCDGSKQGKKKVKGEGNDGSEVRVGVNSCVRKKV